MFAIKKIDNIHHFSDYDDFRISLEARFFTVKVNMKIDITTGDRIIPKEVDYSFKLMFEERSIAIKAYNLNTILAEKIESILARNVSNTRARDFYDVYILLSLKKGEIEIGKLREAIWEKAEERNSIDIIENRLKHLTDIKESNDLINIWVSYKNKYPYAAEIEYADIIKSLKYVLEY